MSNGNQSQLVLLENKNKSLSWALDQALEALQFYKENSVYYYQSGAEWGTECSDVAEITINRIKQTLPNDWRNEK